MSDLIERLRHTSAAARLEAADEIERLTAELTEEKAIVDRIWALFGTPSYDELAGRSIYDLITELQAENERLERQYKGASLYADEITERNNRLTAENECLAHEHKQRGAAVVLAKEWIAERDAEIERLTAENTKQDERIQCLEFDLGNLTAENERLQEKLSVSFNERERLAHHNADLAETAFKIQTKVERLEAVVKAAITAIESLDEDALGHGEAAGDYGQRYVYPLRDELLSDLRAALKESDDG